MSRRCGTWLAVATAIAAVLIGGMPALADPVVELLKKPGHIGFMRHALAPFENAPTGHLPKTELGNCSRQRNLDDVGRADARRIGELFRHEGLTFHHVYTSAWCRCRETAELIAGHVVDNLPLIDSYYTNPDKSVGPRQIADLKSYIATRMKPDARALMVTHGSLISDLTGIDTAESEIVVVVRDRKGGVKVVGRGIPGRRAGS